MRSVNTTFTFEIALGIGHRVLWKSEEAQDKAVSPDRLATHPRFGVHHSLAHASGFNQFDCLSSILSHTLLRRGERSPREDLVSMMLKFIEHHIERVERFKWVREAKVTAYPMFKMLPGEITRS